MKPDEKIGWEIERDFTGDAMRRDNAYYAKLGAAARKAVGERPRMMIDKREWADRLLDDIEKKAGDAP